jgi:metal-responsive CopG/Arc/MetJ family transcriptional regulator
MKVSSLRVVTFKIDSELLRELDRYCIFNRMSRSEAIRKAVILMLKGCKEGEFRIKNVRVI